MEFAKAMYDRSEDVHNRPGPVGEACDVRFRVNMWTLSGPLNDP